MQHETLIVPAHVADCRDGCAAHPERSPAVRVAQRPIQLGRGFHPADSFRGWPESFPSLTPPTRPIRRLQPEVPDHEDLAASGEELDLARVRDAAARPDQVGQMRLEVIAALAVYEASALAAERKADEIEGARGRLLAAIDQLVIEAYSKATLARRIERLQAERARLERALDCLVPEGRMHEVVIPRLQRSEQRT